MLCVSNFCLRTLPYMKCNQFFLFKFILGTLEVKWYSDVAVYW